MNENNLGKILISTRKETKSAVASVYAGICSKSNYYLFESGQLVPEKYLFDALLQRMGKSADQFEAILTEEEYDWVLFKEKVEGHILKKEFEEAFATLEKRICFNMIEEQYVETMKGILQYYSGQLEKSLTTLRKAYRITGKSKYLTLPEYMLLLVTTKVSRELGHPMEDQEQELYSYAKNHTTDTREQVKLLPKTILNIVEGLILRLHLMAQDGLLTKDYERTVWKQIYNYIEEALELLRIEGEILCLRELLEFKKKACEAIDLEEIEEIKFFTNALDTLFKEYDYPVLDVMGCIVKKSIRTEYYLASEYFRNYRRSMNLTQDDMERAQVATGRHIRRIESGNSRPTDSTFSKMEDLTGNQKARITGYMNAVEFSMLEHNAACAAAISRRDYATAERELHILESYEEQNSKQYRQIMERRRMLLKLKKKEIGYDECIEKYKELLLLTQPGFCERNIAGLELNRSEVELLNALAFAYRKCGMTEKACNIWKAILEHFHKGKVKNIHAATNWIATLQYLAVLYEENDAFEIAKECCEMGIRIALNCSWGNALQNFLTQMAYTQERENRTSHSKLIQTYSIGAAIAKLMGDDIVYNYTIEYCRNHFNVSLQHHHQ